jgi:hypothetical protein
VLSYEEMIKIVVNDFVEQRVDLRPWQEVYDHMLDWLKRGHLTRAFIDDCYDAIMEGRPVKYSYEPGEYYGCLFPPKGSKMTREEMNAILEEAARKPIEVVPTPPTGEPHERP